MEYYLNGEGVKAFTARLEGERGQVVRPEDELRLDLPLRVRPGDMYKLDCLAAYYGRNRRELAAELLGLALAKMAYHSDADVSAEDEQEYVSIVGLRDYYASRLETIRQGWRAEAAYNAPDQRREG